MNKYEDYSILDKSKNKRNKTIFKMKDNAARNLKETFAVCMSSYADSTDIVEVKNNNELDVLFYGLI